jgi:hypothetical protein
MSTPSDDTMTSYVVLIYEQQSANWPADIPPEVMQASEQFDDLVVEQGGRMVAGIALESAATATAIRGGMVTDGPFIETKEALAGLYVLRARDLDHAISLARMTPVASGGVEVRPLLDLQVLEQP